MLTVHSLAGEVDVPPDQMVGPYRVIEKLGAGGMGEVFLADDPRLGRSVALKRLTQKGVGSDEQLRRLLQEGTAAAALNHPNIAGIYDVLEADGVAHIVMEYVPGRDPRGAADSRSAADRSCAAHRHAAL